MPLYKAGIIDYTWATKPSIAPLGQIICVTDVGENGALFRGNGTKWVRMHTIRYYDLGAAVVLNGTTTETTLSTTTLKGGLVGANGKVMVYPLVSCTNNANSKTLNIKLGGTTFFSIPYTTSANSAQFCGIIRNRNNESSQVTFSSSNSNGVGASGAGVTTATVNTATDLTLAVTGVLADAADSITLYGFFVEVV